MFIAIAGSLTWLRVTDGGDGAARAEVAPPVVLPAAEEVLPEPAPTLFKGRLRGSDLFAVDARWVKDAIFEPRADVPALPDSTPIGELTILEDPAAPAR